MATASGWYHLILHQVQTDDARTLRILKVTRYRVLDKVPQLEKRRPLGVDVMAQRPAVAPAAVRS